MNYVVLASPRGSMHWHYKAASLGNGKGTTDGTEELVKSQEMLTGLKPVPNIYRLRVFDLTFITPSHIIRKTFIETKVMVVKKRKKTHTTREKKKQQHNK